MGYLTLSHHQSRLRHVIIHTDAGLQGIGVACAYGWPLRIGEWVTWLALNLEERFPYMEGHYAIMVERDS